MSNTPNLLDEFCVLEATDREFQVGILGTGPGFLSLLDIVSGVGYRNFLPPMRLAALAEPGPRASRLDKVKSLGVPVYDTCAGMLAAHPEIDLLIELKGERYRVRDLRQSLPESVSLIDHVGSVFLCGLHSLAQFGAHCRLNLDRQRELLEAIIDEVQEDILLLDKEGRVVDLNRNVRVGAGKDKKDLVGLRCWEVEYLDGSRPFCPGGPDPNCPLHTVLDSGQKAESLFTRVNAQGQLMYFRIYAYPISGPGGGLTHILIMRRDISARTRKEKLRQQADRLAVVGEMSTYLAHEIRNPLFAIAGFTNSLLRMDSVDAKEREKLLVIAEETKRLDRMLADLLRFVRPASALPGITDLDRVASEAVTLMTMSHGQAGYRFLVVPGQDLPRVNGEPEQIKQCLLNLLMNAAEAMPGGGQVVISTTLEGDMVVVKVEDTGRGMSGEQLDQAFSPFFSTKDQGYGLGLAMTKKIVEDLGGRVDLSSRLGQGTVVTLYLRPALPEPVSSEDRIRI